MQQRLDQDSMTIARAELLKKNWFLTDKNLTSGGGGYAYVTIRRDALDRLVRGIGDIYDLGPEPQLRDRDGAALAFHGIAELLVEDENLVGVWKTAQPGNEQRLIREIAALKKCPHPHLVSVLLDSDKSDAPWYIMPFFRAGPISKHHARYMRRPLEVLQRVREIANAVLAMHKENYVHRDIKPDNIFLRNDGGWVLGDLGIAVQAGEPALTTHGFAPMTKEWRPEWVMGRRFEDWPPTVDVHMLAKVAYAMIAGPDKNPPPSQLDESDFDLRQLHRGIPLMSRVQDFIMEHVTAKAQQSKSKTMEEFIKNLDDLIARFERRHYEQTLFSFMSGSSLTDVPAKSLSRLQQLMLFLPPFTQRIFGAVRMRRDSNGASNYVPHLEMSLISTRSDKQVAHYAHDLSLEDRLSEAGSWLKFDMAIEIGETGGPHSFSITKAPEGYVITGLQICAVGYA